jgi:hypothetical protein
MGSEAFKLTSGRIKVELSFVEGSDPNSVGGMSKPAKPGAISRGGAKVVDKPKARRRKPGQESVGGFVDEVEEDMYLTGIKSECYEALKNYRNEVRLFACGCHLWWGSVRERRL